VVRPGALGDAVLTLPALAALLATGAQITVVGDRRSWGFLAPEDRRVRIADVESPAWRGLFAEDGFPPEYAPALRSFAGAVLYLGSGRDRAHRALAAAGLGLVVGATPIRNQEAATEHAAERLLRPVAEQGGRIWDLEAARVAAAALLTVPERERVEAWRALGAGPPVEPVLALHPGSGGTAKRWPLERFAALAALAVRRWRMRPLVLIGPAELEAEARIRSQVAAQGAIVAAGRPVREVAALLSGARAYVGNDSGVTHLAGTLVPSLVLFGPTDPAIWRPLGPAVRVIGGGGTMASIGVAEVTSALSALLGQPPP